MLLAFLFDQKLAKKKTKNNNKHAKTKIHAKSTSSSSRAHPTIILRLLHCSSNDSSAELTMPRIQCTRTNVLACNAYTDVASAPHPTKIQMKIIAKKSYEQAIGHDQAHPLSSNLPWTQRRQQPRLSGPNLP